MNPASQFPSRWMGYPAAATLGLLTALIIYTPANSAAQTTPLHPPGKLPPAREIIENHIKATGGRDAYRKHTSIHLKGTWDVPGMNKSGPLNIFKARPNKYVMRADVPGFKSEVGFNGQVGWNSNEALGPEPKVLSGKELEALRQEAADFDSELNYEKKYKTIETVEVARFEGRDCYKIKVVNAESKEKFHFYDIKTGLFAGGSAEMVVAGRKIPIISVESDYKKFGDLLMSTKQVLKTAVQQILTITSVEFDKVPDSVFELPDKVKAQLRK